MRVLNVAERKVIAGGGTAAGVQALTQTSPTVFSSSFNGVTTTVVCATPQTFSFTLGFTTEGKLVDFNTHVSATPSGDCTITTMNTNTNKESFCSTKDHTCTVIDMKTGQKISEVEVQPDDTGIVQLAEADGETVAELEDGSGGDPGIDNGGSESGYGGGDDGSSGGDEGGGDYGSDYGGDMSGD